MKRILFLLSLAGVLGLAGKASADYYLIRVNINELPNLEGAIKAAVQGGGGGMLGGGAGGPGGPGPGGFTGGGPGQPGGGGMLGGGPGLPGGGGFTGGGPGLPGGAGVMGGAGQPNQPASDPDAVWVQAFVEGKLVQASKEFIVLDHKWGKRALLLNPSLIQTPTPIFKYDRFERESPSKEFDKRFRKNKDSKDKQRAFEQIRADAGFALRHSLMKEFKLAMAELVKLNPAHPTVKSYQRLEAEFKKPFAAEDPTLRALQAEVKADGYRQVVSEAGHYALWTNTSSNVVNDARIKQRLNRMEDTLESFYYWFAMQENMPQPPLPKYRLVAIMVDTPTEFQNRHVSWGSLPMVADGFTPRRLNVMIVSNKHQDDAFNHLEKGMQPLLRMAGINQDAILSGKVWDDKLVQQTVAVPVGVLQTILLVKTAVEEDAERATITHEGVRQLLVASGWFPRTVDVPEWVLTGLASFFESPLQSVYPGVGLPSWAHLVSFKYHRNKGKFSKGGDVLYNVVTDRYFRQAQRSTEEANDRRDDEKLAARAKEDWELARCTSWALVYYLSEHRKFEHLVRYGQELNKLPRDLELDERTLQSCFARAFDLGDPTDAARLDPNRLRTFADTWISAMQNVPLEVPQIEDVYMKDRVAQSQPKKPRPATPPGGFPGPMGPGGSLGPMPGS